MSNIFNAKFYLTELDIKDMLILGTCISKNLVRWLKHYNLYNQKALWDILFNPYVIEKELSRVLEGEEWNNYVSFDNYYRDNIRSWSTFKNYREYYDYTIKKNKEIRERINNARCIFISFGLLEAWQYKGFFLNYVPLKKISRDYSFVETSYELANQSIDCIIKYIQKYTKNNCKIILSVCPVSQKYTRSIYPLYQVNQRAKEFLQEICIFKESEYENVSYFPLYNYIENIKKERKILQMDKRHLNPAGLNAIYIFFLNYYKTNLEITENATFWVPGFDSNGKIVGKLYSNNILDEDTGFLEEYVVK